MWFKAVVTRGGIWTLTKLELRRDFRFGIPIALGKQIDASRNKRANNQ